VGSSRSHCNQQYRDDAGGALPDKTERQIKED